ncbi:MAG: mechanosensitive ion channel family protein [bacterium]
MKKLQITGEGFESTKRHFIVIIIKRFIIPLIYIWPIYTAINTLNFHPKVYRIIEIVYIMLAIFLFVKVANAAVNFLMTMYIEKTRTEDQAKKIRPLLSFINFFIWIVGALLLLSNLGFDISAVIAGLGIGGIAIALAAQAMLGDLFSYFVIFFDQPFELGDFIVFDDKKGTIEKIGIKSTQIRSLTGEIIVISNSSLTNSRIHNFRKLEKRRVVFTIGVTYQTTYEKLQSIPAMIKNIIESFTKTKFDRSHFMNYNNSSLDFETVYFIETADYIEYMNIHQGILLAIYKSFEENKIEFAYPTQTIYLNK